MQKYITLGLICLFLLAKQINSIPSDDLMVDGVPGYPSSAKSKFDTYSGFLNAGSSGSFHYIFQQKYDLKTSAFSDFPIIVWLQGGQGCSSLISFLQETGPYTMKYPNQVVSQALNLSAWIKKANVLYIEAPGEVGFSQYTGAAQTKEFGDQQTADGLYTALQDFFSKFTEFSQQKLFLAGEGFAGQFIPVLAKKLVANPLAGGILSGIALGNAMLEQNNSEVYFEQLDHLEFLNNHGLYGPQLQNLWFNCISPEDSRNNPRCEYFNQRNKHIDVQLNPYNVDAPCQNPPAQYNNDEDENVIMGENATCIDWDPLQEYFNNAEYKKAFNIPDTWKGEWLACSLQTRQMWQNYDDGNHTGTVGIIEELVIDDEIPVILYSGLNDSTIPHYITQDFVNSIAYKINGAKPSNQAEAFITSSAQLGGWTTSYVTDKNTKFQFVKIRAAGHQVPLDQPSAAFYMISHLIDNKFVV